MARRAVFMAVMSAVVVLSSCCAAFAQGETTTEPPGGGETQETGSVYFYLDGELAAVPRGMTGGSQMVEFTLLELLKGPTEEEKAAGYVTYIPEGVKLQYTTVKTDRSEFSVNLSYELMELSGDADAAAKALAQMVKTVQETSGIADVGITVSGEAMGDEPQDAFEALGVPASGTGTDSAEDASRDGGGRGWLVLVIILAALAVCIAAVVAFLFMRRRGSEVAATRAKKPAGKRTGKGKAGR